MAYTPSYGQRKKKEVVDRYGGMCVCCGETELKFLTLDHIDGKGAEHRRSLYPNTKRPSGGMKFYLYLLRQVDKDANIQVLCWNCNCAKHNFGKCPHEEALTNILQAGIV